MDTSAAERQAILAILADRDRAVRASDARGAVAPLTEDVVVYDLQPPLRFAGPAARDTAGLEEWFETWDGPVEVELTGAEVRHGGNLAVVHGLSRMRGTKHGMEPLELWYRTTVALVRSAGTWRIFHEHNSVPLTMDGSGLAATGLTPD